MQRLLDVLFSGLSLLLLSPLLIPIVVVLKFSGEGEVFFLQERVGKNGKLFKLYKFATMLKDSPNIGSGTVTMKGDPRVLPVGRFLRKTKINELPQLLNVFLGDMSIVGPRPQAERCFNAFPDDMQKIIIKVKPGLSGIGPIVFRGEEDILAGHAGSLDFYDQVIAPYKGMVEAWYVDHQTLRVYFSVIAVTVWVVLFPNSDLVWRAFDGLPVPPDELKSALNHSG
ncbi:Sugar transferase involved in LPS biosynthesis (colanic, teichoic acid) [Mariprofundus ferrinatatus]|uniref:Sugar transferase involved in LPS biosynthesis (Colanic, teichoic acid) n=1 Tax=Mariprofundus ferrinatatus TaxID=1921087 RepID=A0A2K8L3U7_9PROT|nr:sugar transferase [Mariprofundus ferrinatatus]ATX82000.1 Sugar transferase involved in LPS biosynthesis (colanic, teichoic acid) [Mariprofundus ferrinatatus]